MLALQNNLIHINIDNTVSTQTKLLLSHSKQKSLIISTKKETFTCDELTQLAAYAKKYGFLEQHFTFLQTAVEQSNQLPSIKQARSALDQLVDYTYDLQINHTKKPIKFSRYNNPKTTKRDNVYYALNALNQLPETLFKPDQLTHFATLAIDFERTTFNHEVQLNDRYDVSIIQTIKFDFIEKSTKTGLYLNYTQSNDSKRTTPQILLAHCFDTIKDSTSKKRLITLLKISSFHQAMIVESNSRYENDNNKLDVLFTAASYLYLTATNQAEKLQLEDKMLELLKQIRKCGKTPLRIQIASLMKMIREGNLIPKNNAAWMEFAYAVARHYSDCSTITGAVQQAIQLALNYKDNYDQRITHLTTDDGKAMQLLIVTNDSSNYTYTTDEQQTLEAFRDDPRQCYITAMCYLIHGDINANSPDEQVKYWIQLGDTKAQEKADQTRHNTLVELINMGFFNKAKHIYAVFRILEKTALNVQETIQDNLLAIDPYALYQVVSNTAKNFCKDNSDQASNTSLAMLLNTSVDNRTPQQILLLNVIKYINAALEKDTNVREQLRYQINAQPENWYESSNCSSSRKSYLLFLEKVAQQAKQQNQPIFTELQAWADDPATRFNLLDVVTSENCTTFAFKRLLVRSVEVLTLCERTPQLFIEHIESIQTAVDCISQGDTGYYFYQECEQQLSAFFTKIQSLQQNERVQLSAEQHIKLAQLTNQACYNRLLFKGVTSVEHFDLASLEAEINEMDLDCDIVIKLLFAFTKLAYEIAKDHGAKITLVNIASINNQKMVASNANTPHSKTKTTSQEVSLNTTTPTIELTHSSSTIPSNAVSQKNTSASKRGYILDIENLFMDGLFTGINNRKTMTADEINKVITVLLRICAPKIVPWNEHKEKALASYKTLHILQRQQNLGSSEAKRLIKTIKNLLELQRNSKPSHWLHTLTDLPALLSFFKQHAAKKNHPSIKTTKITATTTHVLAPHNPTAKTIPDKTSTSNKPISTSEGTDQGEDRGHVNIQTKTEQTTLNTSKHKASKVKTYLFYTLIGLTTLTAVTLVTLGMIVLAATTHSAMFPLLPKFSLWVINTVNPTLVAKGIAPLLLPILTLLAGIFMGVMAFFLGFGILATATPVAPPAIRILDSTNSFAGLGYVSKKATNSECELGDPHQYDHQTQAPLKEEVPNVSFMEFDSTNYPTSGLTHNLR